ncbi:transcription termination/antitermination protein NusG [Mycoplasma procyoni]|nr:transcription termination/antitermination protein NusG [Mycoplasma procyoni]
MISTVSGKEEKVIESLNNRVKSELLEEQFGEIKMFEIPRISQRELEKKAKGEAYKVKKDNLYKGYIFINMNMTDEAWFMIRNTQYVTGLIGSHGKGAKPTPISNREIRKMFEAEKKSWEEFEEGKHLSPFKVNKRVLITDGPFKDAEGEVADLENVAGSTWVNVEVFGKKTPVQFDNTILKLIKEK